MADEVESFSKQPTPVFNYKPLKTGPRRIDDANITCQLDVFMKVDEMPANSLRQGLGQL